MNSSSACIGRGHGDRLDARPFARALGDLLDALDGRAELEMHREVHGIAEVAGGDAQVVDHQRKARGQRQRDADHDERQQGGERRARQPAERAEQRLQMPRAVGRNRAAHVRRSMLGRSASRGAVAVMRAAAAACSVSEAMRPASSTISRSPKCFHQVRIVRGDDHGDADFLEPLENQHDLDGERRVQVAGGFVRDQQLRLADDRACDADALLFTHRQFQRRRAFAA